MSEEELLKKYPPTMRHWGQLCAVWVASSNNLLAEGRAIHQAVLDTLAEVKKFPKNRRRGVGAVASVFETKLAIKGVLFKKITFGGYIAYSFAEYKDASRKFVAVGEVRVVLQAPKWWGIKAGEGGPMEEEDCACVASLLRRRRVHE